MLLTQCTPDELLVGAAEGMERSVLPFLDDEFAVMQIRALCELLLNLATRVDWSSEEYRKEADELAAILAATGEGESPDGADGGSTDRVELLDRACNALSRSGEEAAAETTGEGDQEVQQLLLSQANAEVDDLKSYLFTTGKKAGK
jgi:hypothetical protein